MASAYYPAIIERGGEGFGVYFPDLPGCVSAGESVQDAARNAEEALSANILLSAEYGDVIPAPSDPLDIVPDPDVDEVARLLVRVELPGRALRLNVTLDEGLVAAIDQASPNRSAFLAAAARKALLEGVVAAERKERYAVPRQMSGVKGAAASRSTPARKRAERRAAKKKAPAKRA